MNSIGVMILLAIVIAMYAVYIFNIFKRNDFYEIVYKRLLDVATRATVKNRECIYDILNYTNTSRLDKISITEYKKVISKKIAYYQKRDKLENKVADEIIDCVFKS